jgi:hypothetical protein
MKHVCSLLVTFGVLGALAGSCAPAPPGPGAPPAAGGGVAPEVVERALASVVLVVNARDDGSVTYGSGVVRDGRGLVATNAHLLTGSRSLRAMLYRAGRVSYTPMDGGLGRYLFEYESELVDARVERVDPATDLALLRLDADTSRLPAPPVAARPPRRGDRVFAVGHPQENVWSFTAGQVSALHHGAVQHDALLSYGSSGGPLLDERGALVGVNTAKVVSEARGLAFARPAALLASLERPGAAPGELDLSTPERAAKSCWLAREFGRPEAADCFDWGAAWRAYASALGGATSADGSASAGERERWVDARKDELRRRSAPPAECVARATAATPPARTRALRDELPADRAASAGAHSLSGLLTDALAKAPYLHAGVRVEEVRDVGEGRAWVRLEARGAGGAPRGLSELYVRVDGRWVQRTPPPPDDRPTLPAGWPAPLDDFDAARGRVRERLRGAAPAGGPCD